MTGNDDDKEMLLDALYANHKRSGNRPSLLEAQMQFLPEWTRERLFEAAEKLEAGGDILNVTPRGLINVDLSSTARSRASARANGSNGSSTTINIGSAYNSPIQNIAAGAHGVQNTQYQIVRNDLEDVVRIYRQHADDLKLDGATRRRADAQVATIEAQLLDEPDPTIIQAAGRSLKTIVEGAIGGALGTGIAAAGVWGPLLSLFG